MTTCRACNRTICDHHDLIFAGIVGQGDNNFIAPDASPSDGARIDTVHSLAEPLSTGGAHKSHNNHFASLTHNIEQAQAA